MVVMVIFSLIWALLSVFLGLFGIFDSINTVKWRIKKKQFQDGCVDIYNLDSIIHFLGIRNDFHGILPEGGEEACADLVRLDPYSTEADAIRIKNEYIKGRETQIATRKRDKIQKMKSQIELDKRYSNYQSFRLNLVRSAFLHSDTDIQRIYQTSLMQQVCVKYPKVTWIDNEMKSIWSMDIQELNKRRARKKAQLIFEAACIEAEVLIVNHS